MISMLVLLTIPLISGCACGGKEESTNEEYVVENLIESSAEFSAFYKAERGEILDPIVWTQDPSLGEYEAECERVETEEGVVNIIRLPRIPALPDDDFMVAHELRTLVLLSEGFPSLGPTSKAVEEEVEEVAALLNTMVSTPLRDGGLKQYGYDLAQHYEELVTEAKEILKEHFIPPLLYIEKWQLVAQCVQYILYFEDVLQRTDENDFQLWFDAHYPEASRTSQDLLVIVRQAGYETPEQMEVLFRKIIEEYNLYELVYLVLR